MTIDPITLELLSEGFVAIVREMRATMLKTAYSSILKEGRDFSCALLDGHGQILAQSEDSPAHIIPLSWQVQELLRTLADPLHPGDVLMVNDPYSGGTHLNDVALIQPVFFGATLSFFSVVRAHWGDIGGVAPGSVAGSVDNIFHEGIRIPAVKIYNRGILNEALLNVICANVRVPQDRVGDFFASYCTCGIGARRLTELAERRTASLLVAGASALLDRAEERMRGQIARISPGVYRYEDYLDSDGRSERPLFLPISIHVEGSSLIADFTGASYQRSGPMNCSLAAAATGVFIACKGLIDVKGAINQGAFRPITVRAPERSFLNAQPPAACGGFSEIRRRVTSVTLGALARAIPHSLVGDGKGTSNHINIGCIHAERERESILYEYPSGGTGGFQESDGSHTCRHFDEGEFGSIQPIEVVEAEHPLLVQSCTLRVDSAGAGLRRGGLGMRREIRIMGDGAKLSILSDRNVIPPFGVLGGLASAPNEFQILRNSLPISIPGAPGKLTAFPLLQNDVFVCLSAGGGGYGNALEREPERVVHDVGRGYISTNHAKEAYGVILRNGDLDLDATNIEREQRRKIVTGVEVVGSVQDDFCEERRLITLNPTVAERAQLSDGDLVELVPSLGAPLRAWVRLDAAVSGAVLGPRAREILDVNSGDLLILRSPLSKAASASS